jgi:hypothetical protein
MEERAALEEMLNSEDNMDGSYDWREEENEKTKFKNPRIRDLFPANFIAERERFFELKGQYNPHFCYNTIVSPEGTDVHKEYEELAIKILTNNKH